MVQTQVDASAMRDVFGHFPTGVVVITAHVNGEAVGMTLQSFVSLSLDPPLIMLSPARTSTSWPQISSVGKFVVNFLSEEQGDLARQFARSGSAKFANVKLADTAAASGPVLEGTVAWAECEVSSEFDGGDHLIIVGAVKSLGRHEVDGMTPAPLVFHRSKFGRVEELVS